MHLKNYSLYAPDNEAFQITPAYDLLSTKLVMPEDTEELALTLCGKKRNLKRDHFVSAMADCGLSTKVIDKIFAKYGKALPKIHRLIAGSFLPAEMQSRLIKIIETNLKIISQ